MKIFKWLKYQLNLKFNKDFKIFNLYLLFEKLSKKEKDKVLQYVLNDIQHQTIGLYNLYGVVVPVIEESEYHFVTIHMKPLLGFSTDHLPKSKFSFIKFPDGKTQGQMMNDVFAFDKWYKENFENKK